MRARIKIDLDDLLTGAVSIDAADGVTTSTTDSTSTTVVTTGKRTSRVEVRRAPHASDPTKATCTTCGHTVDMGIDFEAFWRVVDAHNEGCSGRHDPVRANGVGTGDKDGQ